jgi:SAM-dependent methyltransferase
LPIHLLPFVNLKQKFKNNQIGDTMLISKVQGMKYPDEYIVRFFFKEKLNTKRGNVLELGCGNGNNLMLFYQYLYDITGIDISSKTIDEANSNFSELAKEYELKNNYTFSCCDMINYIKCQNNTVYDIVLIPSSIYYMDYDLINQVFKMLVRYLHGGSKLFIRIRTPKDFRFAKGKMISNNCCLLDTDITGEKGCTITFLSKSDLLELLNKYFTFSATTVLRLEFDNIQNNCLIPNSDLVFWGTIK